MQDTEVTELHASNATEIRKKYTVCQLAVALVFFVLFKQPSTMERNINLMSLLQEIL